MKKEIHPEYHKDAKIICACGNEIKTGSTVKEMHIEICSACHPFYTGKEKLIDSAGQVDRFKKRLDKSAEVKKTKKVQKKSEKAKKKAVKKETPTTKKTAKKAATAKK